MTRPKQEYMLSTDKFFRASIFLISAGGFLLALTQNLLLLWQGPSVSLFAPEDIQLKFHKDRHNENRLFLRIGARMAYVNTGDQGFNMTVRRETVSFSLGKNEYVQHWQSEVQFFDKPDGGLNVKYVAEAGPRPINAGSSLTREIYFFPEIKHCRSKQTDCDPDINFLFKKNVLKMLSQANTITFTFTSYLFEEKEPKSVSCTINVTETVRKDLKKYEWSAAPCYSDKEVVSFH